MQVYSFVLKIQNMQKHAIKVVIIITKIFYIKFYKN